MHRWWWLPAAAQGTRRLLIGEGVGVLGKQWLGGVLQTGQQNIMWLGGGHRLTAQAVCCAHGMLVAPFHSSDSCNVCCLGVCAWC